MTGGGATPIRVSASGASGPFQRKASRELFRTLLSADSGEHLAEGCTKGQLHNVGVSSVKSIHILCPWLPGLVSALTK